MRSYDKLKLKIWILQPPRIFKKSNIKKSNCPIEVLMVSDRISTSYKLENNQKILLDKQLK